MTPAELYQLIEATWPPAHVEQVGPFTIRTGAGGGSRVSAATINEPVGEADLPLAEAAMVALDQPKLFMIRDGDAALDRLLEAQGYVIKDPVVGFTAPVGALTTQRPPSARTFEIWPPIAVQQEIWAEGGIGPERLEVMARVQGAKSTILGRLNETPAGCAFVACDGRHAMLHALETQAMHRRQGLALQMMRACGFWAQSQGAETFSLVVTQANTGAHALYTSLGMEPVGHYHYRIKTEANDDHASIRC